MELERRRVLAVERVLEGYSVEEVADFLGVDASSVRRWVASFDREGMRGLVARPASGRPQRLTRTQEKIALRWLDDDPREFGFDTELWTAARLAELIDEEFSVRFHPQYLTRWLRVRGFTPQRPTRVPRERDPQAIAAWLDSEWTRIKKTRSGRAPTSFSWIKAGL